jgi:hypothetical protein
MIVQCVYFSTAWKTEGEEFDSCLGCRISLLQGVTTCSGTHPTNILLNVYCGLVCNVCLLPRFVMRVAILQFRRQFRVLELKSTDILSCSYPYKTIGSQNGINVPLWSFEFWEIWTVCRGLALNSSNAYNGGSREYKHRRNHPVALTDVLKFLVAGCKPTRHKGRL